MATQPERIASLEEFKGFYTKAFWSVVAGAVLWMATLTVFIITIRGDVQAIKQKLVDGGIGAIVSSLQHPESQTDLAHTLSLASAEIRVEQLKNRQSGPEKIE